MPRIIDTRAQRASHVNVDVRRRRAAGRPRRLHHDESGQVSFLLIFIALCLAILIFFVFNSGDQINQQVMAQNAADAAALAGANWLAHGYNVLSMNNVAASRIIALMAMLEAIGPSVELALPNAHAILPTLEAYPQRLPGARRQLDHPDAILARALAGPVNPADCANLAPGLACESLADECRRAIDRLERIKAVLDRLNAQYEDRGGFPAALTRFDDGELWQVLRALQTFSNVVAEIAPGMSQRRAYDVGTGNYTSRLNLDAEGASRTRATFATLLPVLPDFPVRRGTWTDYYDPVMSGLPPDWQPQTADVIKGGYHTILYDRVGAYWPPYQRPDPEGDELEEQTTSGPEATEEEGEDPDERRVGARLRRRLFPNTIVNWVLGRPPPPLSRTEILRRAKGPYKVYRDDIALGTWPEMRLSGFPIIFERISHAAMQAIWNNVVDTVPVPRWETSWDEITRPPGPSDPGGLLARGVNCAMTAWLGTRRNGRDPFTGGPNGDPGGSPWVIDSWPSPPRNEHILRGWFDHAKQNRELDYVWYGQNRVRTFDPSKFGARPGQFPPDGYEPPDLDSQGNPTGMPYWLFWRWKKWLFVGSLFDTDSYDLPELQRLSGDKSAYFPYLLDARGGFSARHTLGMFDVLGFAYRPARSLVWNSRLRNPSPLRVDSGDGSSSAVNLAVAQARVYNPTAWDLWTQNWRVKLVPASHLPFGHAASANMAADLERFHEFDAAISYEQLRPIEVLYQRMPTDPQVLGEVLNH